MNIHYLFRDERDVNHVRAGSGSSDQRSSQAASAFEAYNKPMSTFGKSEPNGPKSTSIHSFPR